MGTKDDDFLIKLRETFKIEAKEHIDSISAGLIKLEMTKPLEDQIETIEIIFREAHSLKGAARSVNMTDIETICQSLESVFAAMKRKEIAPSANMFDILHLTVESLNKLLFSAELTNSDKIFKEEIILSLESIVNGTPSSTKEEISKKIGIEVGKYANVTEIPTTQTIDKTMPAGTVRISTEKLDSILLQAEELLSVKQTTNHRCIELQELTLSFASWKKKWDVVHHGLQNIQKTLERNDEQIQINPPIIKTLEFLDWNHTFVMSLESKLAALSKSCGNEYHLFDMMVENLLDDMKTVLMLPFSSVLDSFPALVRQLSRDNGKEAKLVVKGDDFEIDKRILDEIKDPFIHLLRNCIDHGIEKPDVRKEKNKSPIGTVEIVVSPKDSSMVEILISDDGAGIDTAKIKSKGVELGLITEEEADALSEAKLQSLIFLSGLSTSPIVTDISGRGLGLSIVEEKVRKLGGTVSIENHYGAGITCKILLPLTLATFRGILVRVNERVFILPTKNVEQVVKVDRENIKTVENHETISLNGKTVSLVRLSDVLELGNNRSADDPGNKLQVAVLGIAEKRIAFQVDEVLDELEVLVKSLGNQLSRVRNIAGATVLGTGEVVPILNIPDLMKSAVQTIAGFNRHDGVVIDREEMKGISILVVEDSITARTLLKNILELNGYDVTTAVDGIDAFTILKTEKFDLVVSDVDMPRMSGLDLTAKIRADDNLLDMPVILVTALESREDRERGIDVGANAYVVKSSFDQSNLLELIRRFI